MITFESRIHLIDFVACVIADIEKLGTPIDCAVKDTLNNLGYE